MGLFRQMTDGVGNRFSDESWGDREVPGTPTTSLRWWKNQIQSHLRLSAVL